VPVRPDRVHHRQFVLSATREVIGAEGGGLVHEAGAVVGGDVVGEDHEMGIGDIHQIEWSLIRNALEITPGQWFRGSSTSSSPKTPAMRSVARTKPFSIRPLDDRVRRRREYRHGGVRDEGPRGGRPHQQRDAGIVRRAATGPSPVTGKRT
jgi:hypothetical protein